jgi:aspartyl/asparaginyl beta-hydroxylase (cupin superfamily)
MADRPDIYEWICGSDGEDYEEEDDLPHFYDWKVIFPELEELVRNAPVILKEAEKMEKSLRYTPWPESNLYNRRDQSGDWKVVPLLYTFPAYDPSKIKWVDANCAQCPKTTSILKNLPGVRTALFSRMGANTRLSSHRGWADLANHVLRCHLTLRVPDEPKACGVWVEGEIQHHGPGKLIVFDDSHNHKAFNASRTQDRIVLIFDMLRPEGVLPGVAEKGHTDALDDFIDNFEKGLDIFAT